MVWEFCGRYTAVIFFFGGSAACGEALAAASGWLEPPGPDVGAEAGSCFGLSGGKPAPIAFFTIWIYASLIFDECVISILFFLKISNTSLLVFPSSFANSLTLILTTSVDIHLFYHCPCESFIQHGQRCPHLLAHAMTQFVLLTKNPDWNLIVSTHIGKFPSGVVRSFL